MPISSSFGFFRPSEEGQILFLIFLGPEKVIVQKYFYGNLKCKFVFFQGWMNEIDSYDPNTFSINMSRSVYIKLDGKYYDL